MPMKTKEFFRRPLIVALLAFAALSAGGVQVYVEAESFAELGGWVVDPHSMKALGSSYVMAHGAGKPVADAVTEFSSTTAAASRFSTATFPITAESECSALTSTGSITS